MAKTAKKTAAPKKASTKATAKKRSASAAAPKGKKLVVVESPAKAKTINRYLGNDFVVRASMGHVRDLPAKQIGVDIEHDFTPTYEPLAGRKKVLTELKQLSKSAPEVYLATDLDREGEAIAWHLKEGLKLPDGKARRVVFNEITQSAIRDAFEHPRDIDMDKVNAQQARRILDRIVGYEVSPLLWRKVAAGLSAGRVQTVAVRLIVEREQAIDAFIPEEYWRIGAIFTPDLEKAGDVAGQWQTFLAQRDEKGNPPTQDAQRAFLGEHNAFNAELASWAGKRFKTDNADAAVAVAKALGLTVDELKTQNDPDAKGPAQNKVTVIGRFAGQTPFAVKELRRKDRKSRPYAPFTTAALQQSASVQLRFSASRTMRTAQGLYEGVDVPGEGSVGLITYMRTDSTHLSREAVAQARDLIGKQFGEAYLPEKPNVYAAGQRAQEAHEAIRPTDVTRRPEDLRGTLDDAQYKLYDLIWRRFVACQMTPAVWKVTEVDIAAATPEGEAIFKTSGRTLGFDGYLRVAGIPKSGDQLLPDLAETQPVAPVELAPTQHFTQPPPRYTEASLVKALEADGIGRPSTYAAIIQTIQDRKYVEQISRAFHPTDLGKVVTGKLTKHFPKVFDVHFTADMEDQLDQVEEANADWIRLLKEFYGPFHENLERAAEEMVHAKAESEPSDYECEKCGKPMVYRFSRNGRYLACTGYPDCKQTHPVDKNGTKLEKVVVDIACPKCGEAMVLRRGRFGPFLSCTKYPDCDGVLNLDKKGNVKHPSPPPLLIESLKCPKCEAPMNLRRGARGPWLSCSKYPKCRGRMGFKTLEPEKQKELELALLNHEKAHPQPTIKTLDGTPIEQYHQPKEMGAHKPDDSADDSQTDDSPPAADEDS